MDYPIVLMKEEDNRYSVLVPDLPGCQTYGDNIGHAMAMAREAVVGHIETLAELERPIPEGQEIEAHLGNKEYKGGIWAVIPIPDDQIPGRSVRISITVPSHALPVIDGFAQKIGEPRSTFLVMAAMDYVHAHGGTVQERPTKPRRPGRPVKK